VLDVDLIKAMANDKRLLILEWLRDPVRHFPPQREGDLVHDGVCSLFIAQKIKQWVYYQRDEDRIAEVKAVLSGGW
jgi:ArsR family transcriptional regulator